jgi:hypothetical protein
MSNWFLWMLLSWATGSPLLAFTLGFSFMNRLVSSSTPRGYYDAVPMALDD